MPAVRMEPWSRMHASSMLALRARRSVAMLAPYELGALVATPGWASHCFVPPTACFLIFATWCRIYLGSRRPRRCFRSGGRGTCFSGDVWQLSCSEGGLYLILAWRPWPTVDDVAFDATVTLLSDG